MCETTEDRLLGGHVILRQPADGYRAAVDPVLLAASLRARAGETALDLGCGVGAAMLSAAARLDGVRFDGLELQPHLAALARSNAAANGVQDRVRVFTGDILAPPAEIRPDGYHHVFANPPYLGAERGNPPPDPSKRAAHVEGDAGLGDWVRQALKFCRTKGSITFIQRADRLAELLAHLDGPAGEIVVFPLWPRAGQPAGRVIVRARKGIRTPLALAPGLALHEADGRYTQAADAALKGGALSLII
ncbi:MAG: methyltransferase [Alphaproteobacteria bacterium]|nr:methyltransferase [Alphaproteobacteria bacterium]MBF0251275.1 methyltransferase [Alphaproteobacteria bacterium]